MKAFYFNFSHDVQLASGNVLVNLSHNVQALEYAIQPLAVWMAEDGDVVVVHPDMVEVCRAFYANKGLERVSFVPSTSIPDVPVEPWGWDTGVRKILQKGMHMGPKKCNNRLPDDSCLDFIRNISSRETASRCLTEIRNAFPNVPLCGTSVFCTSEEDLKKELAALNGKAVLKTPWSSSGRGLRFLQHGWEENLENWTRRLFRLQGGIEVQSYCKKKSDWAMEFCSDTDGKVRYTGLSNFFTSPLSAYSGGRVDSQENLLAIWEKEMSVPLFEDIKNWYEKKLSLLLEGKYVGPLGVDMMTCMLPDGHVALHPCVEINFRRTMGQMAQSLVECLPEWRNTIFEIKYEDSPEKLYSFFLQCPEKYMLLTPLTKWTQFAAYLKRN